MIVYEATKGEFLAQYDFKMSWNLGNTETWAIDEGSVHQAGCIHTCQDRFITQRLKKINEGRAN